MESQPPSDLTPHRHTRLQAAVLRRNEILVLEVLIDDGRRFWLLPGGGREPGDDNEAAAVAREVREETGLEVIADRLLVEAPAHPDDSTYERYRTFVCRVVQGAAPMTGTRDGIATIRNFRWLRLDGEESWGDEITGDRFLYPQLQVIRATLADSEQRAFPILEHDFRREAIIEPARVVAASPIAPGCVLCFFHEVIERWAAAGSLRVVTHLTSTIGRHAVYEWQNGEQTVALVHPGLGAPLAAIILEELIALGCRAFVACGGAGVLDKEVAPGRLIVPTSAVRDEGTSYHYLPPAREVTINAQAVNAIATTLTAAGVPFQLSKTWTTDAVYRETSRRVAARIAEGCLTVEMEAAALAAVAQFRGVPLGIVLYAGDDVSGLAWDRRVGFNRRDAREALVRLAATSCAALES
jgi:uridine phosphorylase/8-oxo-dGTP pyrophosphatase MutT (NUDIX family)